jgi:uncharacterized protein (TIGR03435 family)
MLIGTGCFAQTEVQPGPTFEVASVKLAGPSAAPSGPRFQIGPDSLTIRGLSLRDCVQTAWQLPETQVVAPAWLADIRVNILAKTLAPATEKQMYPMLQSLLGERFGLKAHTEQREMPAFALAVAKGGPKFTASESAGAPRIMQAKGALIGEHVPMALLAGVLSKLFGRPVLDETGLTASYDFRMDLTPFLPPPDAEAGSSQQIMEGSMISGLQSQLGLKIESRKKSIDMLVVDHAEKTPTEN